MIARLRIVLLVSVVLCIVSAFVFLPVMASKEKSRGVTLLQLTCSFPPSGGNVNGPGTIFVNGAGACGYSSIATPLPSGTISGMRVAIAGVTTDPTPATLNVVIANAFGHPMLRCNANLAASSGLATCQNLTNSATINAGESLTALITIPDSNTSVSNVAISVEENLI